MGEEFVQLSKMVEKTMYLGRKVMITGASSGLGAEFARQLARKGADVVLVARRVERLEALATEIRGMGREARVVAADLFSCEARTALAEVMKQEGVDLLVNNAGFGLVGNFEKAPAQETSQMIELNVKALVELSHAALKVFDDHKRPAGILNVASTAAFMPIPGMAVYAATKSFVLAFSQALHEEVKQKGIHVSAVCPGPTETEFFDRAGANGHNIKKSPLGLMSAEHCVEIALHKFEQGCVVSPTGFMNSLYRFIAAIVPDFILVPAAGRIMKELR
jgi:short-subunit dehydrogenase